MISQAWAALRDGCTSPDDAELERHIVEEWDPTYPIVDLHVPGGRRPTMTIEEVPADSGSQSAAKRKSAEPVVPAVPGSPSLPPTKRPRGPLSQPPYEQQPWYQEVLQLSSHPPRETVRKIGDRSVTAEMLATIASPTGVVDATIINVYVAALGALPNSGRCFVGAASWHEHIMELYKNRQADTWSPVSGLSWSFCALLKPF